VGRFRTRRASRVPKHRLSEAKKSEERGGFMIARVFEKGGREEGAFARRNHGREKGVFLPREEEVVGKGESFQACQVKEDSRGIFRRKSFR